MGSGSPYLSIVVTSRNDDHGGSLLRRTQTFINALVAQVNRFNLPTELIMVEWNPPPDRPRLSEAIRWPDDLGCVQVRFIEVPAAIHARFRHAQALPLYQMIGKNVGIRRAHGEYVLATNIDILFSDELMAFLASRTLQPDCMYRIDRHDVMTDVPVDASVEERLTYCNNHLIRLNARDGTFCVTPQGSRTLAPKDVAALSAGIVFGEGWFPPEYDGDQSYRWASNDAAVSVIVPAHHPTLAFEIEPGPSLGDTSFELMFVDEDGTVLTKTRVSGRSLVKLELPPGEGPRSFRLRTDHGGYPVRYTPRILNFRVFRCEWQSELANEAPGPIASDTTDARVPPSTPRPVGESSAADRATGLSDLRGSEFKSSSEPISVVRSMFARLASVKEALRRASEAPPGSAVSIPVPNAVRSFLRFCLGSRARQTEVGSSVAVVSAAGNQPGQSVPVPEPEPSNGVTAPESAPPAALPGIAPTASHRMLNDPTSAYYYQPAHLHTNGCGDFTLMARQQWLDLRAYPELDMYSFNIDSVLCYAAHHGGLREVQLRDPMRIYHIEHGVGSGWSPEGENQLFDRLRAKGIGWLEYSELVAWAAQMRRLGCPMIFNRGDWGLGDCELLETSLPRRLSRAV